MISSVKAKQKAVRSEMLQTLYSSTDESANLAYVPEGQVFEMPDFFSLLHVLLAFNCFFFEVEPLFFLACPLAL